MARIKFHQINRIDPEAGLTLIEMIVVLAIIALVAALIVPSVIGRPDQARATVARADMAAIGAALKLYRLDNDIYPTTGQGLRALVTRPLSGPLPANWADGGYLAQGAVDPWGRAYTYRSPGRARGYDLVSLGRDGRHGGEGADADLASWGG